MPVGCSFSQLLCHSHDPPNLSSHMLWFLGALKILIAVFIDFIEQVFLIFLHHTGGEHDKKTKIERPR